MNKFLGFFNKFYKRLRKIFWPVCDFLFPRYISFKGKKKLFITANRITVARTTLLIPFALFYSYDRSIALAIFITSTIFDFVDGLVATIHKDIKKEKKAKWDNGDDPDLGAFLDAFLDKIFWVGSCLIVLAFHDFNIFTLILNISLYSISIILIIIEIILGYIRIQDFYANKWQKKLGFLNKSKDLKAGKSGKLKMLLECLGLIFLILNWQIAGIVSLFLAIPFAIKSILDKTRR